MGLFNKKKEEEKKVVAKKDDKVEVEGKSMKELYKDGQTATNETEKVSEEKKSVKASPSAYRILVRPLITEKAANLNASDKYVFEVSLNANKIEIAKAIKEVYGIKPKNINIARVGGKIVSRGRYTGKRKNWKKAIVTLPKGKTIQIYEGI